MDFVYHVPWEAFVIAITVLTLTPGLDTALVIRNTTRSGTSDGYATSLGICCGLFVHALCSAIGISALLAQSAEWFQLLKWCGAAYLVWLGMSSIRGLFMLSNDKEEIAIQKKTVRLTRSFREGFLSNVLNPKTAIFYLAFLPQFVQTEFSPLLQSLTFAAIHFAIAMIWQCGLSTLLNRANAMLHSRRFKMLMEGGTGVVLVALGAKLLLEDAPPVNH